MSLRKRPRTYYSSEFKSHAIELARSSNVTIAQTARELGIKASLLYKWLDTTAKESASMKASNTNNPTKTRTHEELVSENKRLEKELRQAKIDLEILKKATAYFSNLPE